MKIRFPALLLLVAPAATFAQGPLNPGTLVDPKVGPIPALDGSGNPQPTMKTLHQVEPRVPLISGAPGVTVGAGGNITISQAGNYYLTQNVTVASGNGISIFTGTTNACISIDFNGFTIASSATTAQGYGVVCSEGDQASITVRNGHISGNGRVSTAGVFSGGGFEIGLHLYTPYHVLVSDVHITGASIYAIRTDVEGTSRIENCSARHCGFGLIASTIADSTSTNIASTAIQGTSILNSTGRSVNGTGIDGDLVVGCFGSTSGSTNACYGITAVGGIVINSRAQSGSGTSSAMAATTANSCSVSGPATITNKYNMP